MSKLIRVFVFSLALALAVSGCASMNKSGSKLKKSPCADCKNEHGPVMYRTV